MNYHDTSVSSSFAKGNQISGPKYVQLAESISNEIKEGRFSKRPTLPSISAISKTHSVSRSTVEKSFSYLTKKGIITPVIGKGHYISQDYFRTPHKVCLILNKLSDQKRQLHQALRAKLGEDALIDIFVYNNCFNTFSRIVESVKARFSHYLIVPHFNDKFENAEELINANISTGKVIILDRKLQSAGSNFGCVFENFHDDLYTSLTQLHASLRKYRNIRLAFPADSYFPTDIINGLYAFCETYNLNAGIISNIKDEKIEQGTVYITLRDEDLVELNGKIYSAGFEAGKDVGIISYNESPIKKFIGTGVTTFSTDYTMMGNLAADMILQEHYQTVQLPFKVVKRKSV